MSPSKLRVAYLDLDGTLTRDGSIFRGEHGATLDGALALARLHEAEVEIVPCSGRTVRQLAEVARLLGSRTFVAELGSVVAYDGGARTVQALPGARTASELRELGVGDAVIGRFDLEWHTPWSEARDHTLLMRGRTRASDVTTFLGERFPELDLECIDNGRIMEDGTHAYHVLPRGVDKGVAIRRDREERDLPREACVSFGDSWGDVSMAEHVRTHYWIGGPDDDGELPENVRATSAAFGNGLLEAVTAVLERPEQRLRVSR